MIDFDKKNASVSGFEGTITSLCFDLYGCIQAALTPTVIDNKIHDGRWFDISRLEVSSDPKAIETPNFSEGYIAEGKKGPVERSGMDRY